MDKAQAEQVVSQDAEKITSMLANFQDVHIPGIGTFFIRKTGVIRGRNPQTGEALTPLPPRGKVYFRLDHELLKNFGGET